MPMPYKPRWTIRGKRIVRRFLHEASLLNEVAMKIRNGEVPFSISPPPDTKLMEKIKKVVNG